MSVDINFDKYEEIIAQNYKTKAIKKTDKVSFQEDFGKFDINYFNTGNGILYANFNGKFQQDIVFKNNIKKQDTTHIKFSLNDGYLYEVHNDKKSYILNSNSCILGSTKKDTKTDAFFAKDKHHIYHDIIINNDLLENLIAFKNNSENFYQIHKQTSISFKQRQILHQILQIEIINDPLKSLFLESKIIELLYESLKEQNKIPKMSEFDKKSVQKAKQILEQNYQNPPSLSRLARLCATNEFKLKKSFKALYNTTAYNYLRDFRLEIAKDLLEKDDISIAEAVNLVGYKSISYFSKAFKEKFGINAKDIKKNRKFY